jgi:hypothetical protein
MTKPEFPLDKSQYFIAPIPVALAREFVSKYHYARGGSNTGVHVHGLFKFGAPDDLLGVAWWLPPTKVAAQSVNSDWKSVLNLTRLVVLPGMPTNSASFLIAQSIKWIKKNDKRWSTLLTYADGGQGHTGGIYRATNWVFVETKLGSPVWKDADGRQVAVKSTVSRTVSQMEALGYTNTGRTVKHKFVMHLKGSK